MAVDTVPDNKGPRNTKRRLIEAGREAFIARGYAASSVDEICAAASVTKGGFFHHFSSKEDFASAVLVDTWSQFEQAHADPSVEPRTALDRHIEFMVPFIAGDGRVIPRLATELGPAAPEIAAQVGGYFRTWTSLVRDALGGAGAADPGAVMEFVIAAIEGAPLITNQLGAQVLDNTVGQLKAYLDGVLD